MLFDHENMRHYVLQYIYMYDVQTVTKTSLYIRKRIHINTKSFSAIYSVQYLVNTRDRDSTREGSRSRTVG
jgi:hypothetical protein